MGRNYITTCFTADEAPCVNPGKGWIIYADQSDMLNPFHMVSEDIWNFGTVGYMRYQWIDIEPEEGKYNWHIIDNAINQCAAHNKTFAFGIMSVNTCAVGVENITPQYVFDAGAKYSLCECEDMFSHARYKQKIPCFDDDVYLEKVRVFSQAIADRYGNNPHVEWIDIRCYGNWGENNLYGIDGIYEQTITTGVDKDKMIRCWKIFIDAFKGKKVRLAVPYGIGCRDCTVFVFKEEYEWAADNNVAMRSDGILHEYEHCFGLQCHWVYGKTPAIYEYAGTYQYLSKQKSWNDELLQKAIFTGRPTYMPLGEWGDDSEVFLKEKKDLVIKWTNEIGYNFVLNSAVYPQDLCAQNIGEITLSFSNTGAAPIYLDCCVKVALIDNCNNIVETSLVKDCFPNKWMPQMDGNDNFVSKSKIYFSAKPSTDYMLAIGIFSNNDKENPDIAIASNAEKINNWLIISPK
jgi:hypothetical protein